MFIPIERDVQISAWCHWDYVTELVSLRICKMSTMFVNGKIFQNVQVSHMVSPGNSTFLP